MSTEASPWWHRHRHADRRPALIARARLKAAIRRWFEDQGFVEVDTACLQVSPGNEAHLHAFATEFRSEAGARAPLYLHTSPEFACKKLLAAGEPRIFTFAPAFRNGERGPLHSPEFTMLEWYRADAPYTDLMDDCAALLQIAAATTGHSPWSFRDAATDPRRPPTRVSVARLFEQHAAFDLMAMLSPDGQPDRPAMAEAVAAAGVRVAPDDTWSDLFSRVMATVIEPALAALPTLEGNAPPPIIVDQYPSHEAALARRCPEDPRLAERFELYAGGIELANAFGELTDPVEQRRRLEAEMDEKARVYGERYPIDEDFLAALAVMPQASGCALGFDRLAMLATGAGHIDQVLWTPLPEQATKPA